jgi:hypothetical protein
LPFVEFSAVAHLARGRLTGAICLSGHNATDNHALSCRDLAGPNKPALVALKRRRDDVIEALTRHFAEDTIDLEEFEQRITVAHRATELATLDELLADLEPVGDAATVEPVAPRPAPETTALAVTRPDTKTFVAVMSAVERRGHWTVAKRSRMVAVMGGAELDFREVALPPGVTEVKVYAVMGGVDVIVPPNLAVDCDGWGFMGAFELLERTSVVPDPSEPLLRITGCAVMGALSIETRLVGESGREARRRRRKERRTRRDALERGDQER